MNTLYLECMSGISGDMSVAALLDLGADRQLLIDGLKSLNVDGYHIAIERVKKNGIDSCSFDVHLHQPEGEDNHADEDGHGHDHKHGEGHGHGHGCRDGHGRKDGHGCGRGHGGGHGQGCGGEHGGEHKHGHDNKHEHEHSSEHSHNHDREHKHQHAHDNHQHNHTHDHRGLGDILPIIENSAISPRAKEIATRVFNILAKAEAKAHAVAIEEVHFHEVGAIDSIVDIVAAAICLDNLDIGKVYCTPLREGSGTVVCQHGVIPVPVPATMEIAKEYSLPMIITHNVGEMITPTGAAIVAAITDVFGSPKQMTVKAYGYGAGKKDFETANILRASLVEEKDENPQETDSFADEVIKLECNIDDMTGEALAYAAEKLFDIGALDVWFTPIYMKKSRPGHLLSLIAKPALKDEMVYNIFAHTSTIGVRCQSISRTTMQRKTIELETPYGKVAAKEVSYKDICKTKVEFDAAKKLAQEHNVAVAKILSPEYNK